MIYLFHALLRRCVTWGECVASYPVVANGLGMIAETSLMNRRQTVAQIESGNCSEPETSPVEAYVIAENIEEAFTGFYRSHASYIIGNPKKPETLSFRINPKKPIVEFPDCGRIRCSFKPTVSNKSWHKGFHCGENGSCVCNGRWIGKIVDDCPVLLFNNEIKALSEQRFNRYDLASGNTEIEVLTRFDVVEYKGFFVLRRRA